MRRYLWVRVAIVVAVVLASAWYLYPPQRTINLGLDLQGGIHLVLGVELDKHLVGQVERAAEDFKVALDRKGIATRRIVADGATRFVVELASPQVWTDALTVAREFSGFAAVDQDQAAGRFVMAIDERHAAQVREDAVAQAVERL